jgi:hypothetical protein
MTDFAHEVMLKKYPELRAMESSKQADAERRVAHAQAVPVPKTGKDVIEQEFEDYYGAPPTGYWTINGERIREGDWLEGYFDRKKRVVHVTEHDLRFRKHPRYHVKDEDTGLYYNLELGKKAYFVDDPTPPEPEPVGWRLNYVAGTNVWQVVKDGVVAQEFKNPDVARNFAELLNAVVDTPTVKHAVEGENEPITFRRA